METSTTAASTRAQKVWPRSTSLRPPRNRLLLLDEPTTHLDIRHQLEMLELVARVHARRGLTVVMVLHDLAQAARYAHRLIVVHEGQIAADGTAAAVVTPDLLLEVFGVHARLGARR
jgi:iron complex transport system ATP-binding protein